MARAGEHRTMCQLQKPQPATDGGTRPAAWELVLGKLPVKLTSASGGEQYRGRVVVDTVTTIVEHRFLYDVNPLPTWRYVFENGRTLNIVRSYDPDNRRNMIVSQCKETPTGGA